MHRKQGSASGFLFLSSLNSSSFISKSSTRIRITGLRGIQSPSRYHRAQKNLGESITWAIHQSNPIQANGLPIHQANTRRFLDCRRKPVSMKETHSKAGRTRNLYTGYTRSPGAVKWQWCLLHLSATVLFIHLFSWHKIRCWVHTWNAVHRLMQQL